MAPGQNHRVNVYGALEGETVADAVRFVSSGVSAPGILYVHADHLGSPQKMTDATKTVVWDAVYTPFGRDGHRAGVHGSAVPVAEPVCGATHRLSASRVSRPSDHFKCLASSSNPTKLLGLLPRESDSSFSQ